MLSRDPALEIAALDRIEIAVEPWRWEFAVERREEIERHFADRRRERPAIWNGRVLLLNRYEIAGGLLRGASFETDFASFLAWRDWGCRDASVFNVFSAAALQAADGAYLVGEMADSTASAGQLYFPCGTPDPDDISAEGMLDLAGSVSRELFEETGIEIGTLAAEPGWTLVRDRCFIAVLKRLTAPQSADELRARIMPHLANERQPEFSDIRIVRGPADLHPQMPRFVVAYLEAMWRH
jgi:8-oxo-dGTP pyrophosphatase MutT (NUDIX family)